ncbi:hypothetical protein WJX84_007721, partial [Apatococcus fuscideae]
MALSQPGSQCQSLPCSRRLVVKAPLQAVGAYRLPSQGRAHRQPCGPQASTSAESSRRALLLAGGAITALQLVSQPADASGMDDGMRKKLFDAIAADKGVEAVMREMESQNPTPGPGKSDLVFG